jgi:putative nucleotidyltransferase with HDIG domain
MSWSPRLSNIGMLRSRSTRFTAGKCRPRWPLVQRGPCGRTFAGAAGGLSCRVPLCYTSAVADQETPHADQVFEALELAAQAAEGRVRTGGPCVVPAALFREVASRSPAQVKGLVERVLMGPEPEAGLDVLLGTGALVGILPEVHALVGFGDGEWRHKDVWKHTKQVVRQAVPRVEVRWAALLHDIGKIKTRTISPDGEVHFFGHAEVGARCSTRWSVGLACSARSPLCRPRCAS